MPIRKDDERLLLPSIQGSESAQVLREKLYIDGLEAECISPEIQKHPENVVLIHGATLNAKSLEPALNFFAQKGYRSLTLNVRGHGRSNRPDNFWNVGLADYAQDVATLITTLEGEGIIHKDQLVLIGHSMGGLLAMDFVSHHGAKALIVLGSSLPREIVRPIEPQAIQTLITAIDSKRTLEPSRDTFKRFFANNLPSDFEVDFDAKYTPMLNEESRQVILDLRINRPSLSSGAIRCPILVISGERDPQIPSTSSRQLANHLSADYRNYLNSAHMMLLQDEASLIMEDMETWLRQKMD